MLSLDSDRWAELSHAYGADFMAFAIERPCNVSRIFILALTVAFLVGCGVEDIPVEI